MTRVADSRIVPYPAERAERYLQTGAWSRVSTADRLHETALVYGGRNAVVDRYGVITYDDLDRRSDQVGAAMLASGIRSGDPILFQVANSIEGVIAWYGVLKAGAIPVATLAAHRGHEIGHIAELVGAVAHVVEAQLARFDLVAFAREQAKDHATLRHLYTVDSSAADYTPDAEDVTRIATLGENIEPVAARQAVVAVQSQLDPQDVAVFQLSGGTTGTPKIIPRLHAEYWNNGLAWARALGRNEYTVTCHAAPFVHNAGISCGVHSTHAVGGCIVLPPPDKTVALAMMHQHRVNDTLFGHGMFSWILSDEYSAAAEYLNTVFLSGAKVPAEVFERVESLGARVGQTFGMGEGMFTLTPLNAPRHLRTDTVGRPMDDQDEIKILAPDSEEEVPAGEIGELAARGWYTVPGYFAAPEHNATAFTSDGFYRTGDLAAVTMVDGTPFLSIEGRIKDLINRGGEKINAGELEQLLLTHPYIVEAAVVAMSDPVLGERACAYLVTTGPSPDMSDLQKHLDALGVAKYKWPERIENLASLPRTPVGKIDKKALRIAIEDKRRAEDLRATP